MCATACMAGQDCPSLPCSCGDSSVINTSNCADGCCATEAVACPDACKDNGGWANGGSTTGSGGAGGSSGGGAAFGASCTMNADCQSTICFQVNTNDDTVHECTKVCTFGGDECDAGWDCSEITSGGDTMYLCLLK